VPALGIVAYAAGLLGAPVGLWLIAGRGDWRLGTGPLLMATWALLGGAVDLVLRIEWREPIRPSVFAPYVFLYFFGQMFLWWPLWDFQRGSWLVFGVLFVANTALNLRGHFGRRRERA
jgi:hypothetical protein